MKYNELFKLLRKNGWKVAREVKKHTIYQKGSKEVVLPRHPAKEVPKGTCEQILKQAGLK